MTENGSRDSPLHFASTSENIGMSVVGSVIMLVACFMPMVLFRLLAFVDPGTASGASFRSTMNANGGVSGLLKGKGAGRPQAAGSGAASETASDGRTTSENGAEAETANRWQSSKIGKVGGKVGGVVGGGWRRPGRSPRPAPRWASTCSASPASATRATTPTEHRPQAEEAGAQAEQPFNDTNGDGVANDIPPEAQAAVEDGAFVA